MPREPRAWQFRIQDIHSAAKRIQSYVAGFTFEQFRDDQRTREAVERNFILIGEAARDIPADMEQRFADIPWADMRAIRNFVTHVYGGVDPQRLWDTVKSNLPTLIPQLENMISQISKST